MSSMIHFNHARELKFGIQEKYRMLIYDVKDEPILQNSSQDPSTSSKYDFKDGDFLTHLTHK